MYKLSKLLPKKTLSPTLSTLGKESCVILLLKKAIVPMVVTAGNSKLSITLPLNA